MSPRPALLDQSPPRLRKRYPGRHCLKVLLWACQTVKGRHPRHRRAIRYLAARALDLRITLYLATHRDNHA